MNRLRGILPESRGNFRGFSSKFQGLPEGTETVVLGMTDMYGRLMGKFFDVEYFRNASLINKGTHACDYLLASDMNMDPIPGFQFANFDEGYGDFHVVPDPNSMRRIGWRTRDKNNPKVILLCDAYTSKMSESPALVSVSPRSILKRQMERLNSLNFNVVAASELEFYAFKNDFHDALKEEYSASKMIPMSNYVQDYHIFQGSRDEVLNHEIRAGLRNSGIQVECSKGEAGPGQQEINIRFADVLENCDNHVLVKQCVKQVSDSLGMSTTFMAKPFSNYTGSGCHLHLNLTDSMSGENVFVGDEEHAAGFRSSDIFRYFLGGWMRYSRELMAFYAPMVNSYKRFKVCSWAPTQLTWSIDNRTSGFRVVGAGSKGLRIEFRIPGADVNPYLAFSAAIASGLNGIENKIEPPECFLGNSYKLESDQLVYSMPKSLQESVDLLKSSDFAKKSFGEDVVQHYSNFFQNECNAFNYEVTDWERKRYFEQA